MIQWWMRCRSTRCFHMSQCKRWEITIYEQRYYCIQGTTWQGIMYWYGVMMPKETLWAGLIWTQSLMLGCIKFAGGNVTELTSNVIAESMHFQCDANRNEHLLLDALVDCYKDAKHISLTDQQTSIWNRPATYKTTTGWLSCCQREDGSTSWKKLSRPKECHLVQTAEFAAAQGIDYKPGGLSMCSWKEM